MILGKAAPTAVVAATAWLTSHGLALAGPSSARPEVTAAAEVTAAEVEVEPEAGPGPNEPLAVADVLGLDPGATCLEHDRLSEQVVTWLERDEIDPRLTVVVEGDPIEVRSLRFTLRDRGTVIAERAFAPGPSSCDDLHAVVALAIALAIDATVLESVGIGPASPPEPPPTPPREPAPTPPAEPTPEPVAAVPEPSSGLDLSPRPEPTWSLRVHGRGLLAINLPPTVGGGGQLAVEASWRNRVDLQLGAVLTTAGPQAVGGGTLVVNLVAARADTCAGPAFGRIRPRACVGVLAGSAVAQGRGFRDDLRTSLPWLAVAVGGDVRVALGRRIGLSFGLDGLVNVVRPVFLVREEHEVRQLRELPRLGATAGVGVVVGLR